MTDKLTLRRTPGGDFAAPDGKVFDAQDMRINSHHGDGILEVSFEDGGTRYLTHVVDLLDSMVDKGLLPPED